MSGSAVVDSEHAEDNVPARLRLRLFLDVIIPVADYYLGMMIGAAVGWVGGWCIGNAYAEHYRPVYFANLAEVIPCHLMPYTFARNGSLVGAIAGVIVMFAMNRWNCKKSTSLRRR